MELHISVNHPPARSLSPPGCRGGAGYVLARGYGVMTACYAQVSPDPCDHPEKSAWAGVFDLWPKRDESRADNTTAIGAWAWALSRGMDLAERIPEIDAKRVVATGWSRLAKTALLASVRDERFAACIPNQTGGGGCPLAKRDYGANVATEMKMFPNWYCKAYKRFERNPAKLLTFDQHLLLAAVAPRPLMVQSFDMEWFDTEGEYLALRAASPVWAFLGREPLPDRPFPGDFDESCMWHTCVGPGGTGFPRRTGSGLWILPTDLLSVRMGGKKGGDE